MEEHRERYRGMERDGCVSGIQPERECREDTD